MIDIDFSVRLESAWPFERLSSVGLKRLEVACGFGATLSFRDLMHCCGLLRRRSCGGHGAASLGCHQSHRINSMINLMHRLGAMIAICAA